jgi:hypothetical protein
MELIRDRSGNVLGQIQESSHQRTLYINQRIAAKYDKGSNKTYDGSSRLVGNGDLLATFLTYR